jgi:hypothetical protein
MTAQKSFHRISLILAASSLLLVMSSRAAADVNSADSAAAQALFDQGKQLMAEGKYSEACPKLEESQRLDPTSGTLINLADCYEKEGKLATAWTTFLDAATAANRAGNTEREQAARERAQALAPVLPKIVITVAGGDKTPGLEIKRDGTTVGMAQWGTPIPADEGQHKVTATAPGRRPWETTATIKANGETVRVDVPELPLLGATEPQSAAPGPGAAPPPQPAPVAPMAPAAVPEAKPSGGLGAQRTLALVAGGVGLVGVAVGSVFGLISKSKRDDAASHCTGSACVDQAGVDMKADAISAGNVSTAAFIVGGAGLAGGAVLWFTANAGSPEALAPRVGIGPGSVLVQGAW